MAAVSASVAGDRARRDCDTADRAPAPAQTQRRRRCAVGQVQLEKKAHIARRKHPRTR
jgi:hypothetical protein